MSSPIEPTYIKKTTDILTMVHQALTKEKSKQFKYILNIDRNLILIYNFVLLLHCILCM